MLLFNGEIYNLLNKKTDTLELYENFKETVLNLI